MSLASIHGHADSRRGGDDASADSLVAVLDRLRCRARQTFAPYVAAGKARTRSSRPVPPRSPPPLVCNGASVSVFIAQNGFRGPASCIPAVAHSAPNATTMAETLSPGESPGESPLASRLGRARW
jgi:hypothetical protein